MSTHVTSVILIVTGTEVIISPRVTSEREREREKRERERERERESHI